MDTPRAVGDGIVSRGTVDTMLPATFTPTAGVAPGELRVSRLAATSEPLLAAGPALVTLGGDYHLGTDPDLAALRGDLTLSYAAADLAAAGIADASALDVW